jgi:hypothetical protein
MCKSPAPASQNSHGRAGASWSECLRGEMCVVSVGVSVWWLRSAGVVEALLRSRFMGPCRETLDQNSGALPRSRQGRRRHSRRQWRGRFRPRSPSSWPGRCRNDSSTSAQRAPLFTLRNLVILVGAGLFGIAAGGLTYMGTKKLPEAMLAGGGASGACLLASLSLGLKPGRTIGCRGLLAGQGIFQIPT